MGVYVFFLLEGPSRTGHIPSYFSNYLSVISESCHPDFFLTRAKQMSSFLFENLNKHLASSS